MIRRVLAGGAVAGLLLLAPGAAHANGNPCGYGYVRGCHTGYPTPSGSPSSPAPSEIPSSPPATHHSTPPAHHSSPPQRLPTTGPGTGGLFIAGGAVTTLGAGLIALTVIHRRRRRVTQ